MGWGQCSARGESEMREEKEQKEQKGEGKIVRERERGERTEFPSAQKG